MAPFFRLTRAQKANVMLPALIASACAVAVTPVAFVKSIYTVGGGQRAVIFDHFRGVRDYTVGEGIHFLIPWIQEPFIFDLRMRPYTFTFVAGTKDLQMVNLTLRLLSHPEVHHLPDVLKTLGVVYNETVLPSIGPEVLKAVVAQFNADELLSKRSHVSALVRERLIRRAKDFNIVVEYVAITHLSYGEEFSKAVEKKQVAQQEAERSRLMVAKAEQEQRAAIIRAEGESESAKLIADATAVAGTGLIELRKLEAAKENAASFCSSNGGVMYLPSNKKILAGVKPVDRS